MANDLTIRPGSLALIPHNMSEALQLAEFMSKARTLPAHLQNSPGDCLMIVEQAMRWGMSPFAVAQATSSIKGKLMFEGKLVAAAVENSGAIQGQFDYAFEGNPGTDERTIVVSATRRGEAQPREVRVMLKDARTENIWWSRQPDQQLIYHGTRVWARRWTPAVILGVYSAEEMGDETFNGQTIVGQAEPVQEPPKASAEEVRKAEEIIDRPKAKRNGWAGWLDQLDDALAAETTREGWDKVNSRDSVKKAEASLKGDELARFDEIRARHSKRIFPVPPANE